MAEGSTYLEKTVGGTVIKLDCKWSVVSDLATASLLPKLPFPPDGGSTNEDKLATFYREQRVQISENLYKILGLLKSIEKSQAAMRKHVIPLFLLLGEQSDGHEQWCSDANELRASQIVEELYRIFDMAMVEPGPLSAFFIRDFESISNPVKTIFAHILKTFRPSIGVKDAEWRSYPAAQRSFSWLLIQVKYPYLDEHLEGSILPSLNFLDDFEHENISFGITCLSHIFSNVLKSKVKHSGWGVLVFDHFKKCLTIKHTQLLDKIMPELLKVLKLIEVDPHVNSAKFTHYDSVLEHFLLVLDASDGVNKCIWLRNLTNYLDIMGHATLHWLDGIVRVLLNNTTCIEPQRWLWILKCVKVCIANTWAKPNSDPFAEIILRVLFNVNCLDMLISPDEKGTVKEIQEVALDCFKALSHFDDFPFVREELSTLHLNGKGKLMPEFLDAIQDLFGEQPDEDEQSASEDTDCSLPLKKPK